jgi:AcrR family transcriptional regulator
VTSGKAKATRSKAPAEDPGGKARSRRAAVSEERIIEKATALFAERGYPAISIRDIATACQVNIPSIYHYFVDKDDLYDRCCAHAFKVVSTTLHRKLESSGPATARLKRFTVALCDMLLNGEQFRRILQRELLLPRSKRFESLVADHFIGEYKLLIPAVAEISDPAQARSRAFSIYGMVFGLIVLEPIAEYSGAKAAMVARPSYLAEFVLRSLFPDQDWKNA